jgi:hypothetical protein
MRSRIGMALGPYWGSIVHAVDIIAAISALGAIGGLSALLATATPYIRDAMNRLHGRQPRACQCDCDSGAALEKRLSASTLPAGWSLAGLGGGGGCFEANVSSAAEILAASPPIPGASNAARR